jgi:hypothetical protein
MKRTMKVAGLGVVAVVLAACGSSAKRGSVDGPNTFRLSEFSIAAPSPPLRAGRVAITADNVGRETHELVIVAASSTNDLPLKADGSVDEDKIPAADKVGETGDVSARTRSTRTFSLKPGSYVAFCNIIDKMGGGMMGGATGGMMNGGHVHYALGMRAVFAVQ